MIRIIYLHKKADLKNPLFLAGALGIEPSSGVLETLILPMNYAPIFTIKLLTPTILTF